MAVDKVRVRVGDGEAFDVFFQDGRPKEVESIRVVWTEAGGTASRDLSQRVRDAIRLASAQLAEEPAREAWIPRTIR